LNLATMVYERVKQDIFDFRMMPGDRFTETEVSSRMQASRTPVREALHRLERDGYLEVMFRSGWRVKPFDFRQFEELYDLRVLLETTAVRRLCETDARPELDELKRIWLCAPEDRLADMKEVARHDEAFHSTLVAAAGNREMSRVHEEVTDRIRIIRRLDFTKAPRIEATYQEHAKILRAIVQRRAEPVVMLLSSHIEASKAEVRKITLHMLHEARERAEPATDADPAAVLRRAAEARGAESARAAMTQRGDESAS
jgi:DNA-binding GntR family transcriptional regulator